MEKDFFVNGGIPPQLQYDHHPFISSMPTWHNLSSPMEIQHTTNTNTNTNTNTDNFESAMSSMVSSPAASNSALSNDNYMIRELIGKLGNICNSNGNHHQQPPPPPYIGGVNGGGNSSSNNNSCYSTPISSPPKMGIQMPIMDHLVKENFPNLGNSIDLSSNLPAMPADPGFAERAARFSSFGSRSFNGRTTQFGVNNNSNNNNELGKGSNSKLQRVLSSPSLNEAEINKNSLLLQNNEAKQSRNCGQNQSQFENSRENSSISGQSPPVAENGSNRKRKAAASKGKSKEPQTQSPLFSNTNHVGQNGEDSSAKRSKSEESDPKTEENRGEEESKKQCNANQKPPEPPKDYIHVRARRGQATDSHSLAERVRREKISERMKLLQDLVPGCDKVTGKALMLDEIINYVQSLQRQVEFLSMKLSSVNPRLEFNVGNLFSKDGNQPNSTMAHPMYQIDSMAQNQNLYGQTHQQDSITTMGPCSSMDALNPTINHLNHALHLPSIDGFPQLSSLCEGDLHSIVMGFGQKENGFHQSQTLHGSNPSPLMKIEF